jgi:uncharacterized protein YukE
MSNGRVLATPEARTAVQRLKTILSGDLMNSIQDLERQGDTLADPNQWDGTLANQFRSSWPTDKSHIKQMQTDLDQLQHSIDQITQNIMTAGGN